MKARPLLLSSAAVLALGLACGGDPFADEAAAYSAAMQAPLEDNMALAQNFLEVAADVKKKEASADDIVSRWEKDVLPLADSLHDKAEGIEVSDPALAEQHDLLVQAWGDRAEAYKDMKRAYEKSDAAAFDKAFEENVQAKLVEEKYFQKTNALLEPYGHHLDQFP